nr:reverse transcriptase domain-containing protein [Tanacetum cinerariifolium]
MVNVVGASGSTLPAAPSPAPSGCSPSTTTSPPPLSPRSMSTLMVVVHVAFLAPALALVSILVVGGLDQLKKNPTILKIEVKVPFSLSAKRPEVFETNLSTFEPLGMGCTVTFGPRSNQMNDKHDGPEIRYQSGRGQATHGTAGVHERGSAPVDTIITALTRQGFHSDLREYCNWKYHQLLPIIAEKVHQEKVQQEKLKAVKARLNFEEASQYFESGASSKRMSLKERLGSRHAHSMSGSREPRRGHFESPRKRGPERRTVFKRLEKGLFHRLGDKEKERWAMPTWCHMFNSTLTGNAKVWFDDLPKDSIDSYDDLKEAFLENYLHQKKCIKDLVEIHNIKRGDEEFREQFVRSRAKAELQEGRLLEPTKAGTKARQIHSPHKNTKIDPGYKQRKVQAFSANDNPGRKRNASKFCEFHGEVGHTTDECMHLKRKIEEMLKARQAAGDTDGTTMVEGSQVEGYSNFLSRVSNFFSTTRGGRWDGGSHDYQNQNGRTLRASHKQMILATTPLVGFSEEIIWPLGQISLLVKIGDEEHSAFAWMNFMVPADMTGVPRHIAGHMLNIREGCLPVRQKKRGQAPKRNKAICKEVEKLVDADIMKEVYYHSWLSNPVMTTEAQMAFKQMKKWIAELPMLTAPKEKKELIMYPAASKEANIAVLMTKRDGKQMPIYFVTRALQSQEVNYTPMEKLILASILSNPEVAGRFLEWRFELEEHDIHYRPRTSAKGQILTDFIIELLEDDPLDTPMEDKKELPDPCVLFTDGSSCIDGSRPNLIMTTPKGMEFTYALKFRFNATNNEAEYEALIAGLRIAEQIGIKNLQANVDSRLVSNQVNRVYAAKEPGMIKYLEKVKNLISAFEEFSIKQVPRGENKKSDALSKMASTSFAHLSKQVLVEELKEKSIDENEVLAVLEEEGRTWMTPIYEYLTKEILPKEKRKARSIRRKAGELRFTGDPRGVMQHACRSEICGGKSFKIRVFWKTMDTDARNLIEAKPVAAITGAQVKKFVWDNILCRFGLPRKIIFDKGKQFRDNPFKDLCEKLCIRECFTSVKHPQANGLVERANRSLSEGIKAQLDKRSKNWLEDISHVLWAHRTMIKSSNGETPFSWSGSGDPSRDWHANLVDYGSRYDQK